MHPFNFTSERIGKISDFVSAAINEAREKERELEREKKKEEASSQKKKVKIIKDDQDDQQEDEDDGDGFTTIEDNRGKNLNKRNPA